jgi:hypothetical protein
VKHIYKLIYLEVDTPIIPPSNKDYDKSNNANIGPSGKGLGPLKYVVRGSILDSCVRRKFDWDGRTHILCPTGSRAPAFSILPPSQVRINQSHAPKNYIKTCFYHSLIWYFIKNIFMGGEGMVSRIKGLDFYKVH